jgi:hypothetical protein
VGVFYCCGVEEGAESMGIARGFCEAMIKAAPAATCSVGDHAIEGHSAAREAVEALVEEVPQ